MCRTYLIICILLFLLIYIAIINPMHMFRSYHFVREMCIRPSSLVVNKRTTPAPADKRIALCISGQFRDIKTSFMNHITTLLPLQADIFIVGNICITPEDKEKVLDFYKPIRHRWTDQFVPISLQANTDRMFSKMYYCDQLRQTHEEENGFTYDYVIRIRPDLVLLHPFPSSILSSITRDDSIYFPTPTFAEIPKYKDIPFSKIYLTDQLFVGTSAAMKIACECYLRLSEYITKHCINEYMLLEHLVKSNLVPGVFYLSTSLSRSSVLKSGIRDTIRSLHNMLTIKNLKNTYVCSSSLQGIRVPYVTFI